MTEEVRAKTLDPESIEVYRTRVVFGVLELKRATQYPQRTNLAVLLVNATVSLALLETQEALRQGIIPEPIERDVLIGDKYGVGDIWKCVEDLKEKVEQLSESLWRETNQGQRMQLALQLADAACMLLEIESRARERGCF